MNTRTFAAAALVAAAVTTAPAGAASRAGALDAHWLRQAARTNLYEIAGARIAASRATSPAAKNLAATVERDHQRQLDSVARLAGSLHVGVSGNPTATQHWELHVLTTLQGTAFDQSYAWLEEAHQGESLADAQDAAAHASSPAVRALARGMIPTLRAHLRLATAAKSGK